jgi:hypothetical protein
METVKRLGSSMVFRFRRAEDVGQPHDGPGMFRGCSGPDRRETPDIDCRIPKGVFIFPACLYYPNRKFFPSINNFMTDPAHEKRLNF